jgi:hypothetical protein
MSQTGSLASTFILQRLMISSRWTAMNSCITLRIRPIFTQLRRAVRQVFARVKTASD